MKICCIILYLIDMDMVLSFEATLSSVSGIRFYFSCFHHYFIQYWCDLALKKEVSSSSNHSLPPLVSLRWALSTEGDSSFSGKKKASSPHISTFLVSPTSPVPCSLSSRWAIPKEGNSWVPQEKKPSSYFSPSVEPLQTPPSTPILCLSRWRTLTGEGGMSVLSLHCTHQQVA